MKFILLLVFVGSSFISNAQIPSPVIKAKSLTQTLKMETLFNHADPIQIQPGTEYNDVLALQTSKTGKMPVLKIDAKPVIIAELSNGSYLYKLPIDNMPGITGDIRLIPVMPVTKK